MPVMWRGPGAAVKKGPRISLTHLIGLMKRPRGTINATGDNTEETTIDLRGLSALRTRKAPSRLQVGATLVAECTDPLAEIDIRTPMGEPAKSSKSTAAGPKPSRRSIASRHPEH